MVQFLFLTRRGKYISAAATMYSQFFSLVKNGVGMLGSRPTGTTPDWFLNAAMMDFTQRPSWNRA
jgi:hypothetical protein